MKQIEEELTPFGIIMNGTEEEVFVDRFGFSVDVQNQSWVVGAPGTPNSDENKSL